jgi:hypothetical protein
VVVFALGAIGVWYGTSRGSDGWPGFVLALSEAFVIAVVVAVFADPIIQERFAEEWGERLFWAIFSRDAPGELKRAVGDLADLDYYEVRSEWRLRFDWAPGSRRAAETGNRELDLVCSSERFIVRVDRRSGTAVPDCETGIIDRCDGKPSRFTKFEFKGHAKGSSAVILSQAELDHCSKTSGPSNRLTLQPRDFLKDCGLSHNESATVRVAMKTRVRDRHSIPLFSSRASLKNVIRIEGPPVSELSFSLLRSRITEFDSRTQAQGKAEVVTFESVDRDVSFPGHGIVVEWAPRARGEFAQSTSGL